MEMHPIERQSLYSTLAVFFRYPDEDLLDVIDDLDVELLADIFPGVAEPPLPETDLLEQLQTEYTGFFINAPGGVPAPPYGSVYLEPGHQVMGETTRAVEAFYADAGLAMEGSEEPADYLPIELEFMAYLTDLEVVADAEEREADVAETRLDQARFLKQHLGAWVPKFCQQAAAGEPPAFYAWAIDLLQQFVAAENHEFE